MKRYRIESAPALLGAEIVKARKSRKLTQRSLATKASMSRVSLANLEAGRGSVAALVAVLDFLEHRFTDHPLEIELGRWVAQSRKSLGLSQDRLCAQAGISKPAIIRIERGEGNVATLVASMDALGLSMSLVDVAIETAPPPLPAPTARLFHGDCRDHMRDFAQQGLLFDAVVCDPPYHLASISRRFGRKQAAPLTSGEPGSDNPYRAIATGFMQQTWDGGGIAFDVETWRAAYDVLKPGGYIIAFGGARTFHRLAVAIEDAGFEIRDTIMWLFASGFPKSHNVGRGIEGLKRGNARYSGRTMPSEQSRLPPGELLREMASGEWSGRSVRIDDSAAQRWQGHGTALKPAFEPIIIARRPIAETSVASNVLRFGTGAMNIDACRVPTEESIEQGRTGRKLGASVALTGRGLPATGLVDVGRKDRPTSRPGSKGIASYTEANVAAGIRPATSLKQCVEAPRAENGLNGRWPANVIHDGIDESWGRYFYAAKASKADRGTGNKHPTVKPTELMRYLVRLVTPPGGVVFDPFMGSGSTGVAAIQESFSFTGCEQQDEYIEIARRRIERIMPSCDVVFSDPSEETPASRTAS